MVDEPALDPPGILRTYQRIAPFVRQTPLIEVGGAELGGGNFCAMLKLELLQHSGSFKTRGAFAHLLSRTLPAAGVIAASGGNHGAAVAYAAKKLSVPARIFVPNVTSAAKLARIREYGAELQVQGDQYADALEASRHYAAASGALEIHAYDQLETLLGQGTVGAELDTQCAKLDTLLVAVGGGGLIGGIAAWYRGRLRIIGVEPEAAPTLSHALAAGAPIDAPAGGIAADSLAPRRVGQLMFPLAQQFVDRVLLVSDEAIRRAQRRLWDVLRIAAEPGGAAACAALCEELYRPASGERVGVLVCGGNTAGIEFN